MVSGYIRMDVADGFTNLGQFVLEIELPKCSDVALATLRNKNGRFTQIISKTQFIQIMKNIQEIFTLAQTPFIKLYEGSQLIVEYRNRRKGIDASFINVFPRRLQSVIPSNRNIQSEQPNAIYASVIEYLKRLVNQIFFQKTVTTECSC